MSIWASFFDCTLRAIGIRPTGSAVRRWNEEQFPLLHWSPVRTVVPQIWGGHEVSLTEAVRIARERMNPGPPSFPVRFEQRHTDMIDALMFARDGHDIGVSKRWDGLSASELLSDLSDALDATYGEDDLGKGSSAPSEG